MRKSLLPNATGTVGKTFSTSMERPKSFPHENQSITDRLQVFAFNHYISQAAECNLVTLGKSINWALKGIS